MDWIITLCSGFGVALIWMIACKKIQDRSETRHVTGLMERETKLEQKQKEARKQQEELVQKYVNSDLLQEMLNYICKGDYKQNKPREIVVYEDRVQSDFLGQKIVFDFVSNRIPVFTSVFYCCEDPRNDVIEPVKPQVAMAEAINRCMQNEYEILDKADYTFKEVRHSETESDILVFYASNYVLMRLKATRNF